MITPITATFPALNFPKEVDYPTQEDWAAFSAAAELNYGILSGEWSDKSEEFKEQTNNLALEIQGIGENAINAISLDTIEDLATYTGTGLVMIKDINRGGTFVSKTEVDIDPNTGNAYTENGGTIFVKLGGGFWVRQYSGAINVKWFGYGIDGKVTLYVSTTGSDINNSGFSLASPFATIQKAIETLMESGPVLIGTWCINLAAGTYQAPTAHIMGLTTKDYIEFCGPDVSGGVPTAIIDANGGEQALRVIGRCNVKFQDIKCINATGSSVASGIIVDNGGIAYAHNVHTFNTTWAGINFNVAQRAVVYGGRFENSAYGLRCYGGTVCSIGRYNSRPQLVDCLSAGVVLQGSSYGHVDYSDFTNCGIGIYTAFDSHAACLFGTFNGCDTPAQTEHNSSITFEPTSMTGYTREMRSRRGVQTSSSSGARFFEQILPYSGTQGRAAYGYNEWVVPVVNYQYSNNGTTSGFNLSSLGAATALWESSGNTIIALAAPTANYSALWFADSTHERRAEIRQSGGGLFMIFGGISGIRFRGTDIAAMTDNTLSNGTASLRWSVVYAGTGTINTSDAREKTFSSIPEVEKQVANELKGLMRRFKFNDAIETKGIDNARIHYGTSAQEVISVFEKYGLNAMQYAMVCYDEWEEQEEVKDEEGTITQEYRPAGNRYGIRYEELLCFIISAM